MEGPTDSAASDSRTVALSKNKRGCYRCVSHASIKNNLLAGVGYLELANAGDFAANVWNEIPVPRHAMILMAIGGPIALSVSLVAARDYYLSWQNVKLLRCERKALQSVGTCTDTTTIASLGVNSRELGTELIDRMFMDLLLGIGALLVGAGTIMAIWGADHRVFEASNLMSGFIGNGFAACFGVVNAVWSGYLVYRFQIRYSVCLASPSIALIRTMVLQRYRRLQWHSGINGVNGLVAGMASMVTARMWWGYVVLIPCVIVMIAGNLFWRRKLGYDRLIELEAPGTVKDEKMNEDDACCEILATMASNRAAQHTLLRIVETGSLETMIAFIHLNRIFESFCEWMSREWPDHRAFATSADTLHISHYDMLGGTTEEQSRMVTECRRFLAKAGVTLLDHRHRYLLELAGEVVWRGREQSGIP
ncbi:hypothetical protein BJX68DRAFT_244890 [Aspergillus pseudodeflectus]|uniref:Integral membrane protein n=1 Tax=Aspergillus pseudodeflectus TaxID=176178 RepID=A0ABR4JQK8_9EURO